MSETTTTEQEVPVIESPAPQETVEKKTPPWEQRRIDQLTRLRREEERRAQIAEQRAQALEARLAQAEELLRKAAGAEGEEPVPPQPPGITKEQFEAEVAKAAAIQRFNEQCNKVFADGKEEFDDFEARVAAGQRANALTPTMAEIVLALDNPHQVLHSLLGDLDEAARIAELPPARMAIEIAKFAQKRPARVSKAPPPVTPTTPTAAPTEDPEKMTTEQWMAWRRKQLAARQSA